MINEFIDQFAEVSEGACFADEGGTEGFDLDDIDREAARGVNDDIDVVISS